MATEKEKAEKVLEKVVELLKEEVDPEKIILFGSRAKGKSAPYSDIDLAIEGSTKPPLRNLRKLKEKIEAMSWPFFIDLIFLEEVDKEFKELVTKTGRIVYEKNRSASEYKQTEKSI
ncbi:MAG: nucleotidyltransferase domain-containing protein [Thermodesulfobacterium sp.]|nr:nucleotidyltransferase domain-containing protein [Thermodesulfobacterium sp.]